MPTRAQWEQSAATRIVSILRTRLLCTQHQLESKISEAGPLSNRPHPLSISDGLTSLAAQNRITSSHTPPDVAAKAYSLRAFDENTSPEHRERYDMLNRVYPIYVQHAGSDPHCAHALEAAVHASFENSSAFEVVHSEIHQGSPKSIHAAGRTIDNSPPIDHVVRHKGTGILMLVEDKNTREWFYPRSRLDDLARLTAKAIRNGLAPMLITRKVPYVARRVFAKLGLLAFQTHSQYFHPEVEDAMREVRHTDGLGFHDIRFSVDPIGTLAAYLDKLPDAVLSQYRDTFLGLEETIRAFAIDRRLGYYELLEAIGLDWGRVNHEAYDYDEYN